MVMNCRTQVVLAAGAGYLLGRQRKLRWGLMLAAAAATGRLSRPGGLLQHGVKALSASPELEKLSGLAAPLMSATKAAVQAATTGRVESVTHRLRERADLGGRFRPARGEREEEPEADVGEEKPRRRSRADARPPERDEEELYEEPEDEAGDEVGDEPDEEPDQEPDEEPESRASSRPARREPTARRPRRPAEPDDDRPRSGLSRTRADSGGRSPVRSRAR